MKIFGIVENAFDKLILLIIQNPRIEKVVLFGSRAIGMYQDGSDIDLALYGPNIKLKDQLDLTWKLEKSDYPYTYDFQIHKNIKDRDVLDHIDRVGIIIYQKLSKDMSEWKEYELGDVLKFGNGKTRPTTFGENPIYGGNGILGYTDLKNYEDETIIIGRVGAYCGAVYYENRPIWVSDNALASKPKENNNARFLYFFLKNLDLNQFALGSSHPLMTQTLLNSIDIKICESPEEQKAIAAVLSSLDDKIDLLHRQNKTLESLAETLFRQWFIEEAQDDWEDGTLGDLIELVYGKGLKSSERTGIGFPVVGSNGIVDFHSEYLVEGPGIVIGRKGTLGKTIYLNDNFYPIDTTYYVKSKQQNEGLYFEYFLLKSINFEEMNTDSAVPGLNRNIALSSELIIPPCKLIQQFNEYGKQIFKKKTNNLYQIRTLEKIRDTLLPKLMSGEVRVKYEHD